MIYKHGWEAHQFMFMIVRMQVRDYGGKSRKAFV